MKIRDKRRKSGSAYLMALGVLAVLVLVGIALSRMTLTGRWTTIFSSNEKKAEECAESAANLTFKIVKDNMNDYSAFWKLFSDPDKLLKSWFMYFRLPAPVAGAYVDPVSFENAKENGVDVQLDLFNSTIFKPLYEKGIVYMYDTISPDPNAPLAPLKGMFDALGGRVRVICTARIKNAFAILADNPDYVVGGVEVPLRKVTGFLGNIYDKIKIGAADVVSGDDDTSDPTGEQQENAGFPNIDIANFLPNDPLLEAPDISNMTIIVQGVPVPVGAILQVPLDKIFKKIQTKLGLTPQKIAKKVFGSALQFKIDFEAINKRIEQAIQGCLPPFLRAFAGNASFDVTVEKQGFFEVVAEVEYTPQYPNGATIKKKLVMHREFRVADIQPIAPDYTFFVANSKLLYEKALENFDSWQGDDKINWNEGMGTIVIHNMPSISEIWESIKNIFSFDIKQLVRELKLPGLVRVNGTKEMLLKLTMFEKFPVGADALEVFKKMEIAALCLPHKDSDKTACCDSHDGDSKKHNIIPGIKSVLYNFWATGKPFDWGYFGGGDPGGIGMYWLPVPPQFARTLLFGNFHLEFPLSMRVEGYLKKVYSHIKLLLVKIYIPPIPIIGFLGMDIPIPWFWAQAKKEPYGFCQFPPYKNDDEGKTAWDPKKKGNLPANVYSPTQYLKKASYFYPTSMDFKKDIENRTIIYNGKPTFICDGITFVNDNLWLDEPLHVMGRGIIVAAANIHIQNDITREDKDANGNNTLFSLVARNGAIINHYGKHTVYACLFGDKGLMNPIGANLTIHGNLVVNRFNRKDCQGNLHVYYDSNHCRSSLLSMIRPVAKWDPTRYYVTLSAQTALFKFEKQ
ncbi:MAG: hypothetical protein Kow0029_23750 [Candidatus Rifleibacteriota bacterium]